jgi:hypothetical protein
MIQFHQLPFRRSDILSRLRKFWQNEGGATAVVIGIMSPIIIGGMALGGETGYWYYTKNKLQHAADVAAYSAGVRKRVGESGKPLQQAALQVATASGFVPAMDYSKPNPVAGNLAVNDPPADGTYKDKSEAVQVRLFETKPRLLSSIFSKEPVKIEASAVAMIIGTAGGSPACVLALSEDKSKAVEVTGNTSVTLNGCSVAANSVQPDAYYMPNSTADLTADCISTVGGASIKDPSSGLLDLKTCSSAQEHAPKTLDPYADVAEPQYSGCDRTSSSVQGTITPRPDPVYGGIYVFCAGVNFTGNTSFGKGLYIVKGGNMTASSKYKITGEGVTFFFAGNTVAQLSGQADLVLSAPTTGPLAGILFFSERCDPSAPATCNEVFQIEGGSDSNIRGAVYLPGSAIEFRGNSTATNDCLQLIADKITFTGNSTLQMGSACSTAGTKEVKLWQIVKLVE